jgi:8-oxo-dGTP pyrophosphatase MutT (NUDIX family)
MSRDRFKLSVAVFLFLIKNDSILLLKRENTGWMDGFFSVPAGSLDGSETLAAAAIRETSDEVGSGCRRQIAQYPLHPYHALCDPWTRMDWSVLYDNKMERDTTGARTS